MKISSEKILVIHPSDPSTNFLCRIYRDINCTVIRNPISKSKLKKMMVDADRIIMLGHGTEQGLIGFRDGRGLSNPVIDSNLVYILREKKESVYIWCNADQFVEKYKLSGFSTGMFISEEDEAIQFGIFDSLNGDIDASNEVFAFNVGVSINNGGGAKEICQQLFENYEDFIEKGVVYYNQERFYNFEDGERKG